MFFRRNISLSLPEVPNSGQRELRLKKNSQVLTLDDSRKPHGCGK